MGQTVRMTRREVDVRPAAGATALLVLLLLSIVTSVLLTIAVNAVR